jgi:hypothetical protein
MDVLEEPACSEPDFVQVTKQMQDVRWNRHCAVYCVHLAVLQ